MGDRNVTVRETVDARKERFSEADLASFFKGAKKIVASKGKRQVVFNLAREKPDPAELAKAVLGPSGNLRAPTLKVGTTYLVGFGEEAFSDLFG